MTIQSSSQSHLPAANAFIERRIKPYEGLGDRVIEIDRVGALLRIESLRYQVELFLFEGRGDLDLAANTQKHRNCIVGQTRRQMIAKGGQVEIVRSDKGCHAGAALAPRDGHAINVGLKRAADVSECANGFLQFGRR